MFCSFSCLTSCLRGGTQRQTGYDNNNFVPLLPDATALVQMEATVKPNTGNVRMAGANNFVGIIPTSFKAKASAGLLTLMPADGMKCELINIGEVELFPDAGTIGMNGFEPNIHLL